MNIASFSSDRLAPVFEAMVRPAGLAMRTPLKSLANAVISRLPEGPTPDQRQKQRWMIVCEARRDDVERKGVISGRDVYGLTGAAIARGATLAAGKGYEGRGGLAPSQAFEPKAFLTGLERFDVRRQIFENAVPAPVEA
jgi:hypothetical protein